MDVIGRPLRLGQRTHTIVAVGPRGFAGIDDDPVDVWVPLESRITRRGLADEHWLLHVNAPWRGCAQASIVATAEAHASQVFDVVHQIAAHGWPAADLPPHSRRPAAGAGARTFARHAGPVGRRADVRTGAAHGLRQRRQPARPGRSAPVLRAGAEGGAGRHARTACCAKCSFQAVAAGCRRRRGRAGRSRHRRRSRATCLPAADRGDRGRRSTARLAAITIADCAVAALLLGLAPAVQLTSTRAQAPGRARSGAAPSRLVDAFVDLQVALAVPLLVGTGLFGVSFWTATHVDFGPASQPACSVVSADFVDDGRPGDAHAAHRRIQARLASCQA